MVTCHEFENMFTFPKDPGKHLAPGESLDLNIHGGFGGPLAKKAVITDIYIENLGGGDSLLNILEKHDPSGFKVRYTFHTVSNQVLIINFTTGLRLGEQDHDDSLQSIRIENAHGHAHIHPRVNGFIIECET